MPNSLPLKSILTLESVTIWSVYQTMRWEKVILESLLPYKILALLLLYIQIMCLKVIMMEAQSIINTYRVFKVVLMSMRREDGMFLKTFAPTKKKFGNCIYTPLRKKKNWGFKSWKYTLSENNENHFRAIGFFYMLNWLYINLLWIIIKIYLESFKDKSKTLQPDKVLRLTQDVNYGIYIWELIHLISIFFYFLKQLSDSTFYIFYDFLFPLSVRKVDFKFFKILLQ